SDWIRKGRSSPASSASIHPVLRSAPDKSPSIKAPAEARVSARPREGARVSFNSTSAACQSISVPDHSSKP
ncbi:MAG: hypothetical protein OIF56_01750, partial [Cohaesibacter sp.]|nr:hypothetical protein [Cohaesibacter sp.]